MTTPQAKRILKILLVDDDPDTRQLVTMIIEKAGHKIQTTGHGKAALTLLEHEKVDIILLDIMMPEVDGLNVLENIRMVSEAPVIMLTALSDAHIMEQSYLLGADDYIIKPFAMNKLIDRIDRLSLQLPPPDSVNDIAWTKNYKLDIDQHVLASGSAEIDLTANETRLLLRLMKDPYMEVSQADLYEAGWGIEMLPARTIQALVENTINGLRSKLEKDPQNPRILVATQNGYMFNPE